MKVLVLYVEDGRSEVRDEAGLDDEILEGIDQGIIDVIKAEVTVQSAGQEFLPVVSNYLRATVDNEATIPGKAPSLKLAGWVAL